MWTPFSCIKIVTAFIICPNQILAEKQPLQREAIRNLFFAGAAEALDVFVWMQKFCTETLASSQVILLSSDMQMKEFTSVKTINVRILKRSWPWSNASFALVAGLQPHFQNGWRHSSSTCELFADPALREAVGPHALDFATARFAFCVRGCRSCRGAMDMWSSIGNAS